MKKKILSLLMSAAVLLGTFPAAVSAEETAEQSGAKFGVKRGDIVTYAGKDTPIEWRVIDPDKTNTDDNKGMLLLSENDVLRDSDVTYNSAINGLSKVYKTFYDSRFNELYRSAVMAVNKKDLDYEDSNGNLFKGELSGDTVFALSKAEADNLSDTEKAIDENKFTANKSGIRPNSWWLRSVKVGKGLYRDGIIWRNDPTLFAYVSSSGSINSTTTNSAMNICFRPAVNLDKTKLANLDGKPLLLPAGEFTEADWNLAPTGTASKWKLSVKNDVKINSAYSNNTDTLLSIDVTTGLTDFSDNDYISVIIVKPDGSIPYYGRFTMNRTGFANIRTDMPSDIDTVNDSLYVFYENYNSALSGSVSELKKVCFKHDLEYEIDPVPENNRHYFKCKNCGLEGSEPHTMSYQGDELTHTGTCELCGYKVTGNHEYGQYLDASEKEFKCSTCGKHTFTANAGDLEKSNAVIRNDEIDYKTLAFESCTTQGDPRNFLYVSDDEESSFTFYDCTDNTATVTFKTKHAVKATGIRTGVPNFGTPEKTPSTLTLYGKNSDSEEYKKIGAVVFRPILSNYSPNYYSFLFADTASIAPYSDYKLELYNENSNTIMSGSFGLFSEPGSALNLSLTGALAQSAPSAVYPGVDSTFTLTSLDGHPKKSEISVTTADSKTLVDSCWTYDENSGKFTLLGEHITNSAASYNVTVICENRTLYVERDLSGNLTSHIIGDTVFGKDVTCYILGTNSSYDSKLYAPLEGDYTVMCGNNNITEYCKIDEESMLTIPKDHITASEIKITAHEAGMNDPESSEIMIERKGTPRYYRTVEDSLRDMSYPGSKDITVISKNDTVSIPYNAAITLNGTEINLNLNGKTLDYEPFTPILIETEPENEIGTIVNVMNGTIKSPGYAFEVHSNSTLNLSDVALLPSSDGDGAGEIDVNNGDLKIYNSDSIEFNGVYVHSRGRLTLQKGTINNLTLSDSYRLLLIAGKVGNLIYNDESQLDYNNFLFPGAEFYDIKDLDAFNSGKPTGFSVKCGHAIVDQYKGSCNLCNHQFVSAAINDTEKKYYDNFEDAVAYASINANTTVRLFCDTDIKGTLTFTGKNTTFDLNGKSFTMSGESKTVYVYGTLTITGGGTFNAQINTPGTASQYTVESGTFTQTVTGNGILNGGTFAHIITYKNFAVDMLGDGMVYKKNSDNTFVPNYAKDISDVTVTKAPFKITKQPENKFISDISAGGTISVETDVTPGYGNDITYRWYEKAYHPANGWMENELDVYTAVYQLPTNAYSGEQKLYKCVISCKRYSVSTDYAICTFGSNTPHIEYDSGKDFVCAKNYDKDAVLALVSYRNGKLLAIKTKELKANSGPFYLSDPFYEIKDGADCLKIFLWDGLDSMNPLTPPISKTRRYVTVLPGKTDFAAVSEGQPCTVIIASYNGNKFIDSKSVRLDESNNFHIETEYKSLGLNTENSDKIKTFVWKDFQTMQPIPYNIDIDENEE